MSRATKEWIGKTDDTSIPGRVRIRLFDRVRGRCAGCGAHLLPGRWAIDHIIALINGGGNRESNLQCLCDICHSFKSSKDAAEKSRTARKRRHIIGIPKTGPAMPGSRRSKWKRKMDGTIERRDK